MTKLKAIRKHLKDNGIQGLEILSIDCSKCLYKDYGNYDIEITVSNNKGKSEGYIYLWNTQEGKHFGAKLLNSCKWIGLDNLYNKILEFDKMYQN